MLGELIEFEEELEGDERDQVYNETMLKVVDRDEADFIKYVFLIDFDLNEERQKHVKKEESLKPKVEWPVSLEAGHVHVQVAREQTSEANDELPGSVEHVFRLDHQIV